jgi:hypothetical protein
MPSHSLSALLAGDSLLDQTARPESLNLEELSDNVSDNVKALKAHPDPD